MSSTRAHYEALKARIEVDPKLHVSPVMKRSADGSPVRESYVIVWPTGPETIDDERLAKDQDVDSDCEYVYDWQAVAVDALGAGDVADRVIAQVIGQRLEVAGRRCDSIRITSIDPVEPDSEIRPPLFYVNGELSFFSRRT